MSEKRLDVSHSPSVTCSQLRLYYELVAGDWCATCDNSRFKFLELRLKVLLGCRLEDQLPGLLATQQKIQSQPSRHVDLVFVTGKAPTARPLIRMDFFLDVFFHLIRICEAGRRVQYPADVA